MITKENKDKLERLEVVRKKDMQESLFYCWDLIPEDIQEDFISWCLRYTQRSYGDCIDGWGAGWHKEYRNYVDWLKGKWHNPITEREKEDSKKK